MSKPIKDMVTQALRDRYAGVDSACVVSLSGLDAVSADRLRTVLREKRLEVHVIKNNLARRAFRDLPLAPLGDWLNGPCAIVSGEMSAVDMARELVRLAKDFGKLELKHGIIEGDPGLVPVPDLSKMRGRKELIGEVLTLISSPGRKVAGCLQGAGGKIAGCLKTLADREEAA